MRPVTMITAKAQALDIIAQFTGAKYTNMPPGGVVILLAESPTYFFWPEPGNTGAKKATRFEHPFYFFKRTLIIRNMLQDLAANHFIEGIIGKWQLQRIG